MSRKVSIGFVVFLTSLVATTASQPSQSPQTLCQLSAKCEYGLKKHRPCMQTAYSGGHACYEGLKVWQKDLSSAYGCPHFSEQGEVPGSHVRPSDQAFCWCGLGKTSGESLPAANMTSQRSLLSKRSAGGSVDWDWLRFVKLLTRGKINDGFGVDLCKDKWDEGELNKWTTPELESIMSDCARELADYKNPPPQGTFDEFFELTSCFERQTSAPANSTDGGLELGCAGCFGLGIQCALRNCIEECTCAGPSAPKCNSCMKTSGSCADEFYYCSGFDVSSRAGHQQGFADALGLLFSSSEDAKQMYRGVKQMYHGAKQMYDGVETLMKTLMI